MFLLFFFLACLADLVPFERFNEKFVACQINNCTGECRPTRFVKRELEDGEVILSAIPNDAEIVATRTTQQKSCELLENSACSAKTFVSVQMDFCFDTQDVSTCQLGCGNVCQSYYKSRHYHDLWLNSYVQTCFLFCCLPEISGECVEPPCDVGETAYSSLVDLGCTAEMEARPALCDETMHSWEIVLASGILSSVTAIICGILFARFVTKAQEVKTIEYENVEKKRKEMNKLKLPPKSLEMTKMSVTTTAGDSSHHQNHQHRRNNNDKNYPQPHSEKQKKDISSRHGGAIDTSSKRRPRHQEEQYDHDIHYPPQSHHTVYQRPHHPHQKQSYQSPPPQQQYHTPQFQTLHNPNRRKPYPQNNKNMYSPKLYLHQYDKIPDPHHMPHWDNWLSFFICVHRQINKNTRNADEIYCARELRNNLKYKLSREEEKETRHHLLRSRKIVERLRKVLGGREKLTFEFLKATLEIFSSFLNVNLFLYGDFGKCEDYCRINDRRNIIHVVCLRGPGKHEVFVSVRNQTYISGQYLRNGDGEICRIGDFIWFKNQPARISAFKQRGEKYQFDALIEITYPNQPSTYQFVSLRKLFDRQEVFSWEPSLKD